MRCSGIDYSPPPVLAPLFRFFSSRSSFARGPSVLLGCSARDVTRRNLRFRAHCASATSSVLPTSKVDSSVSVRADLLEFSSLPLKIRKFSPARLSALWISCFVSHLTWAPGLLPTGFGLNASGSYLAFDLFLVLSTDGSLSTVAIPLVPLRCRRGAVN
jgi:hypothetical protein